MGLSPRPPFPGISRNNVGALLWKETIVLRQWPSMLMSRRLPLLCVAVVLFAACSTVQQFSDTDQQAYVEEKGLTDKDSVYVMQGKIYQGMPIGHALAALGAPNSRDTTTTVDGQTRVEYTYKARPNAFDPGNLPRAYVYARDQVVTDWTDLDKIPRFDAYYEGGM